MVQNNKKTVFHAILDHFRAIGAPLNGSIKIHEGPQVREMYGLMFEHENKPLTKSLGPFF
jgi:hypothetical protein